MFQYVTVPHLLDPPRRRLDGHTGKLLGGICQCGLQGYLHEINYSRVKRQERLKKQEAHEGAPDGPEAPRVDGEAEEEKRIQALPKERE